ncbi:hypothetical protein ACFXKS_17905 [Streptomyces scopuliridis]|uniref:hypothetical protein n=1 Tax=Streptomyces scopuliridis TaxID=452529 RepID=UPI00369C88AA
METELEYRAVLAVDIERSAGRGDEALMDIRGKLAEMLREAFLASGVDWEACLRHDLGDGLRVTAPAGTRKTALVHPLVRELALRLRTHNRGAAPRRMIRLRIALHAGDVHLAPNGEVAGSPLEVLARLLDAPPARTALAEAPETVPASLLLSRHFYDETVRNGYHGVYPEDFRKVTFTVKEHTADAWLHLPGWPMVPAPTDAAPEAAAVPEPLAGAKMISRASENSSIYAVQRGTQHINITGRPRGELS